MPTITTLLALAAGIAPTGDAAAMGIAKEKWGVPQCGIPRIETSTPRAYEAQHGTGYFPSGEPLAWADEDRCVIVFNPRLTRYAMRTPVKRCHILVHEWGHLAGRDHSENPRSVMYGNTEVVGESRELVGRRSVWRTAGAFAPCAR